jgi:hypothetical protein
MAVGRLRIASEATPMLPTNVAHPSGNLCPAVAEKPGQLPEQLRIFEDRSWHET